MNGKLFVYLTFLKASTEQVGIGKDLITPATATAQNLCLTQLGTLYDNIIPFIESGLVPAASQFPETTTNNNAWVPLSPTTCVDYSMRQIFIKKSPFVPKIDVLSRKFLGSYHLTQTYSNFLKS